MSRTRARLLQILRNAPEAMTIAELAKRAEVHVNTVRFHLEALSESGLIEQVRAQPTGPGRPASLVRAVTAMDRTGPRTYLPLAQLLLDDVAAGPRPKEHALRAGKRWGQRVAEEVYADHPEPVAGLMEALGELEFAPERTGPTEVELHHCPFLELTTPTGGLVCDIHLGLMQGVLEGTDVQVERLDPFVRPDLCCARLNAAG